MSLPDDNQQLVRIARRLRLSLERGTLAGRVQYRIRQRVSGRGERSGLRAMGRVEDFCLVESLLIRKPRFRRLVAIPMREVNLCLDLSALRDVPNACRLLDASVLIGAAVLDMKSTTLTVTAMGTSSPVIPFSFSGLGGVGRLKEMILSLLHAPPGRPATAGQLQRAVLAVPNAHMLIVSHYLDPRLTERFAFPWGATVIDIEPFDDGWTNRFGTAGGFVGVFGADAVYDEMQRRYAQADQLFSKLHVRQAVVKGNRPLAESLIEAMGRRAIH